MNNYYKILALCCFVFSYTITISNTLCFAEDRVEDEIEQPKESLKKIKKTKKRNHNFKFRNFDTNEDKEISLKEYIEFKKHSLEKSFDKNDRNQDGVIDRKEFSRMQKEMRIKKKRSRR